MIEFFSDPVAAALLVAVALVIVLALHALNNQRRESRLEWPRTFPDFVRTQAAHVLGFFDRWAPVFRTRTGAYSTLQQMLAWVGVSVAAPRLEVWTTVALIAALVYCWARTIHGRANAKGPIVANGPHDPGLKPWERTGEQLASRPLTMGQWAFRHLTDETVEGLLGVPSSAPADVEAKAAISTGAATKDGPVAIGPRRKAKPRPAPRKVKRSAKRKAKPAAKRARR